MQYTVLELDINQLNASFVTCLLLLTAKELYVIKHTFIFVA